MAWIDLSGANAPLNASGTERDFDISAVKDFDPVSGFVAYNIGSPLYTGMNNPVYLAQVIENAGGGGGGSTRPTSGMIYPRGTG